jgi:transposase
LRDWRRLDERIEGLSNEIEAIARLDAGCERLISVPGIGPIISSAMVAAIGAGDVFSKGRDFAAWLGLVPRQISTGDRTILGKISKRGNRYLRVLFVQAAWVVLIKRPLCWSYLNLVRDGRIQIFHKTASSLKHYTSIPCSSPCHQDLSCSRPP